MSGFRRAQTAATTASARPAPQLFPNDRIPTSIRLRIFGFFVGVDAIGDTSDHLNLPDPTGHIRATRKDENKQKMQANLQSP